ncbi:MAG: hypothetical protein J6S58_07930 [Lentisphaeria bacterium]|nr:hypothetical protein [Lentisphaeria bacterium]
MKRKNRIRRKYSVLMEYTLLLCSILPLVMGVSASVYSYGLWGGSFGSLGKEVVAFYQRIITVISLPIP